MSYLGVRKRGKWDKSNNYHKLTITCCDRDNVKISKRSSVFSKRSKKGAKKPLNYFKYIILKNCSLFLELPA